MAHHHVAHFKIDMDAVVVASEPVRMTVTRGDLETLAVWIAAKYDLALFHDNAVQIRTHEENLKAIMEWANDMAEAGL